MTTGIDVDGRAEATDVNGFFDAPPDPVLLVVQDGDVLPAEMVPMFAAMLKHG